MPTKIDGNNGVLQSYDYQVLTTGFSYTFATGITTLIAQPAGTLATGTITMPAFPADGMVVTIESTQQVTAVTVQGNTGQSLVGAASQLIPNQPLSYIYRLSNTTWYPMAGGAGRATAVVSGTAVASTSGTSIDFTGIPSWVERITVMIRGVSTNGSSLPQIQLGDSGGIETTSYNGSAWLANTNNTSMSTGFLLNAIGSSTYAISGAATILNMGSNVWVMTGTFGFTSSNSVCFSGGDKTLSDVLDRIRITTANGTDAFDAGTINILYE